MQINTDEDPSLRIESSAIINLRGVSTKLDKYIVFTMQTYRKLSVCTPLHTVLEQCSKYFRTVKGAAPLEQTNSSNKFAANLDIKGISFFIHPVLI